MAEPFTFEEAIEPFTFEEAAPKPFSFEEATEAQTATVAQMAAATRHTVGVVGRAIAANDLALSNRPDTPTEDELPTEQAAANEPQSVEVRRLQAQKQIQDGLRESALATRRGNLAGFGEGVARSVDIFGALNWVGRIAGGFAEDLMLGRVLPTSQRVAPDLAATGVAVAGVEGTAPPPQAALTPTQQGIVEGARGLPPIVVGGMLAASGVPPPAAFAMVMGGDALSETGDPAQAAQSAAIGAVLPGMGQATKQLAGRIMAGAVNKGLISAGNVTAQKSVEAAAELVGIAAFNEAMHLPGYATMTPDERSAALQRALGANLAFLPMIVPTVFGKGRTATQEAIDSTPAGLAGRALSEQVKATELADPNLAALKQIAPLTAEAVAKTAPIEAKPAEPFIAPVELKGSDTPLTTAAVESVKEPAPSAPAPTPAVATSGSGTPPVPAGVPPAKPVLAQEPPVAKLESEQSLTTEGEPNLTGIKNAKVDEERASRGQEPILRPQRLSNQTVWDRVMSRIEAEPRWQDTLIEELKTKPRTPSADEVLALDHRYVELKNGYEQAVADGIKAKDEGRPELVEKAAQDAATYEKWLSELEQVAREIGTEWGRSGQMRQRLLREDFTLAAMEARARANNGFEPLTEAQHIEIKELHDQLAKSNQTVTELEAARDAQRSELEAQRALTEAARAAVPEYPPSVLTHAQRFVDFMHTKGDAARARIRERMSRTSAAVDPTVLADAAIIGAEHLSAKALDLAKFTEAMVRDLGEWVREHAQEIFDASKKALSDSENSFFKGSDETTKKRVRKAAQTPNSADARTEATNGLKESVAEGADGADIGRYARAIAETFIKDGIKDLEPLTDAVHGVLKEVLPEITRTESRDAWTQYGKYKPLNPDPVKVRLRELSTEGQKVSTIERLEKGLAGLKTGSERQPPTDKARRLQKEINELKKKLGIVTTNPETQLRSALDAIKTRNKNRIADLRFENSTRTRIVKNKRVTLTDEEVVTQRAEIEALKKQNEEIFGGKELTDEQRLARAISASERAETAANERLNRAEKGDFSKPAGRPLPESAALDEIRARTAALREETKHLKDLANPKKTPDELAMQALKSRIARDTADFTRRIAEGDFSPRRAPPRELPLDPATAASKAEVEALRGKYAQLLERYQYQQKTRLEKIWHGVKKTRGVFVNLVSSFDFSAPRQALPAILSNLTRLVTSPRQGVVMLGRPFGRMFQAWSSETTAGRIDQQIKGRANAVSGADKAAGIHYAELNAHSFTKFEENAHSILDDWARLPLKTGNLGKTVVTAPGKLVARGVRASNRAFITFLNSTRAELFDELLRTNYGDRAPTKAELEIIGNMVNVATGRGKVNPQVASVASGVIWAPYLLASRVQALVGQPLLTGKWAESGRARGIVAKEYARAIISGYLLYQVSRLFSDKDETNLTSSDFGKIIRGNTRIDLWGGFQQVTTLAARTISATTTSLKGKESDIGAARKYGQRGIWYVWSDFARSKLRPDVGAAVDILTRETGPLHAPTTPASVAKSVLVPLPMREITDILKEHGFTEGMIMEALGQFGAGINQYEGKEAQK